MFDHLPPFVRSLLWANAIVFALQWIFGRENLLALMLWPWGEFPLGYLRGELVTVGFLPWQVLTYGFLHADFMHLFFNMFALLMFGAQIEQAWGARRFGTYYLTCLVGAGFVQLIVATWAVQAGQAPYPTLGASGGVFGVLLAYGMLFPHRQVMLLIPPIPMKARTLVIGYGVLELVLGITGTESGVAHFAHLGGMLFGFVLIQYWRRRWPFGGAR